jgi:hypothetical protein
MAYISKDPNAEKGTKNCNIYVIDAIAINFENDEILFFGFTFYWMGKQTQKFAKLAPHSFVPHSITKWKYTYFSLSLNGQSIKLLFTAPINLN